MTRALACCWVELFQREYQESDRVLQGNARPAPPPHASQPDLAGRVQAADWSRAPAGASRPRGQPGAFGVVSPVEVRVADEAQRRRTLDSAG
jgi:hypothetical protein